MTISPLAILSDAREHGYLVGSFSPRYVDMIKPVLLAGQRKRSPLFLQISQMELERKGIAVEQFAQAFEREMKDHAIDVPVVLHLDHTTDTALIRRSIEAGFRSVMIDASLKPFAQNVAQTVEIIEYAHARGVFVEGELGRIEASNQQETENADELYTVPAEAEEFCRLTGVDYLAVSIGTVHGVYRNKTPKLRVDILRDIRLLTDTHLVMHGGSGLPLDEVRKTYGLVSKMNIATDLELAMLAALCEADPLTQQEFSLRSATQLTLAQEAVARTVEAKISVELSSAQKA